MFFAPAPNPCRAAAIAVLLAALLTACASRVQIPGSSGNLKLGLSGELHRPDRSGRLPAAVLLAPCGGVTRHMGEWAAWLNDHGYVTLVVDSFSPRFATDACQGGKPTIADAARDAIDALAYLRSLSFVDPNRVAVIGWSHGAGAALQATSSLRFRTRPSDSGGEIAFQAAIAFYPPCQFLDSATTTPTLLLLAGRDDWTPPNQCVAIGERTVGSDRTIVWQLYPTAHHAFDRPDATPYLGHTMVYDSEAAAASHTAVLKFLSERL